MNPEEMQVPPSTDAATSQTAATGRPDMSDDDVAALLGFTTTLSEHMFHGAPEEGGEMAPDAETGAGEPQSPPTDTPDPEQKNDRILQEIQGIRDDMKIVVAPKSVEQEVSDIRKELEALKNEPSRENTSTGE